ncbi:hypothetical protein GM240_21430 [Peribacillus butanolivorans]|nr:hypothetical protein GM240_21430 [Peribacillus butanolivorans]
MRSRTKWRKANVLLKGSKRNLRNENKTSPTYPFEEEVKMLSLQNEAKR